ncbi:TetR/AcrR family transcriptional regulator [Actinomycetospora endophytica]|uniref:TetR/AcrR family transcriptional regulator n=1 Tax=Actinomycetospora endophytica TaxID=2291215 RepID=A0ABS8PCW8_9PSEU|nr:TetR/AcrR family transcriptional regulator C-terminal domain-containing protein [Actinomycetospora endophytica]MCD2196083.1 TetR/AcrR family transcriptional regulator [Actinomycetospora endophytica]
MPRSSPVSRRDRPAKPALSRESVVAAAVELVRELGTERVTMRRLAQELDTGPASLYVYVRDTAELHAAVLDVFLAEVDLTPVDADGDWRDRLWGVLESYTAVLFPRPGLARAAMVTHPSGPNYLALVDGVLALLAAGGIPADRAAWAVDVLLLVATATAAEHGTRAAAPSAEAEDDELVAALTDADPAAHPHIAALGPELFSGTGPDRSRWFVDVLLAGATVTPRPAKETP